MGQEEIIKRVAYRTNLPEAQVKLIISHFWQGIKYFISNAQYAKYGILINDYIKIKLRMRMVYRMVHKYEEVSANRKYHSYDENYWKDILANLKKLHNPDYIKSKDRKKDEIPD